MTICRDAAACTNEAHKNQMHCNCTSSKEYSESMQQRNNEQQL